MAPKRRSSKPKPTLDVALASPNTILQAEINSLIKIEDVILTALREGATLKNAAYIAEIHPKKLAAYLRRGMELPDSYLGEFRMKVLSILAKNEHEAAKAIYKAGLDGVENALVKTKTRGSKVVEKITTKATNKDWRAAAWYLEHRFPKQWDPNQRNSEKTGASLVDSYRLLLQQLDASVAATKSNDDEITDESQLDEENNV